jgi:hypothetical protein
MKWRYFSFSSVEAPRHLDNLTFSRQTKITLYKWKGVELSEDMGATSYCQLAVSPNDKNVVLGKDTFWETGWEPDMLGWGG